MQNQRFARRQHRLPVKSLIINTDSASGSQTANTELARRKTTWLPGGDAAQELAGAFVPGMGEELVGRARFSDAPPLDEQDAVGHGWLRQRRKVLFPQPLGPIITTASPRCCAWTK
jgi:hypothetical protein